MTMIKKRIVLNSTIIFLAAICMLHMSVTTVNAETVSSYDVNKAVTYAEKHVNDSKQDCVEFVRDCFEAGGVPKDANRKDASGKEYGYTEAKYIEYITYRGYATLTPIKVKQMNWYPTGKDWYVQMSQNKDNLSVGDGIAYYCTKCKEYFHFSFVSGVNEDGYALYYSQKRAVVNKPLCKIACSDCKASKENTEIYGIHLTTKENGYSTSYNNTKVTGLSAKTTGNGKMTLSWKKVSDADGYYIFKKNSKGSTWSYEYFGKTKDTSMTISKLPNFNEVYNFVVRPYKERSERLYVGAQSENVLYQCKPVVTVKLNSSSDGVNVSWTEVPGATSYKVSKSRTGKDNTWRTVCEKTTKLSCVDKKEIDESWYYRVIATKSGEKYSMVGDFAYYKAAILATPSITSIKNVASTGKVYMQWNTVKGAKKYEIYRSKSGKEGSYSRLYTTTKTNFTNTSIEPGQKYYYKVRAINTDNNLKSKFSSSKSATGKCAAPNLKVNYSSGKPKLSWKKISGATEYHIYSSKTGKSGSFKKIATTKYTSYTYKSAKKGVKTYYIVYAVKSSNSNAKSASSNVVSATSKK